VAPGGLRESEEVTYPAYVPYFPRAWRRNRSLANASAALHVLAAVGAVLQVIGQLWLHSRVEAFRDDEITRDQLSDAARSYFVIVGAPGLISVANLIVWIVLLWRMARNQEAIGRPGTRFGVGWAIAGPLVPLVNAVVPWLQMNELWKGSDPDHQPMSTEWRTAPSSPLVNLWWAAELIGVILAAIASAAVFEATLSSFNEFGQGGDLVEVAQDLVDHDMQVFVASTLVAGLATILGAVTLRTLAARQEQYAARFNLDQPAVPSAPWPAMPVPPVAAGPPPGWFPDPSGRFDHRWWDGTRWTDLVSRDGTQMTDPL
jgi:hypothetical protein